jgi:hypothetical protein
VPLGHAFHDLGEQSTSWHQLGRRPGAGSDRPGAGRPPPDTGSERGAAPGPARG